MGAHPHLRAQGRPRGADMKIPIQALSAALFVGAILLAGDAAPPEKAAKVPEKTEKAEKAAEAAKPEEKTIRAGVIGLDTSHATAFAALLNDPQSSEHVPGARI